MGFVLLITILLTSMLFLTKKIANPRLQTMENEFDQAGVKVSFSNGTIAINKHIYDAKQVKRIRMNSFEFTTQDYEHIAEGIIIEIDDATKPVYKIQFVTSEQAQNFMQRLIMALKNAGSPKLV